MQDDLYIAEREWRQRNLFRTRTSRVIWLRRLIVVLVAAALLIWQDETLAWLASLMT